MNLKGRLMKDYIKTLNSLLDKIDDEGAAKIAESQGLTEEVLYQALTPLKAAEMLLSDEDIDNIPAEFFGDKKDKDKDEDMPIEFSVQDDKDKDEDRNMELLKMYNKAITNKGGKA